MLKTSPQKLHKDQMLVSVEAALSNVEAAKLKAEGTMRSLTGRRSGRNEASEGVKQSL